ncbi:MAG TPA: pyridoxal 5'-phosphate synthase glutaminase subunit PdxT [Nitrososphaeraceae archaeon]|nr:pyridoxal 5'-phosphate synthase glutaminase subunit PdxT [Nitrososphaeraceae archaeon]
MSENKKISIGVLGIQGDIEENLTATRNALKDMEIVGDVTKVIYPEQIERIDGLILPGGESTVISSLIAIHYGGIFGAIKRVISNGLPTLGTCAGMIMLSRRAYDRVVGDTKQQLLGNLDIEVERNAFGRQSDSFELDLDIPLIGKGSFRGIFIRSPVVKKIGNDVSVLAKINGKIVGVKYNNIIGTAFHPELSGDIRLHKELIKSTVQRKQDREG